MCIIIFFYIIEIDRKEKPIAIDAIGLNINK